MLSFGKTRLVGEWYKYSNDLSPMTLLTLRSSKFVYKGTIKSPGNSAVLASARLTSNNTSTAVRASGTDPATAAFFGRFEQL